jgi:hypothetical protein
MTTTINASTTAGLVQTADTSGILALQTAGTTAVTVDASQRTAFVAGTAALPAITTTGDTNTGIFFPAADTIAFSEGGVESMRLDSSANLQFNSGYGSVATAYGCRAWVNFNGTGTVAIRASGNVSSITDNGTGDYTVNFTTAMPDANYAPTMSCSIADGAAGVVDTTASFKRSNTSFGTGSFRLQTAYNNSGTPTALDSAIVTVSVFR